MDFDALVAASKQFEKDHVPFPTQVNRIAAIVERDPRLRMVVEKHAHEAAVVIDHKLRPLFLEFLALKRSHGSPVERKLYNDMAATAGDDDDRLLRAFVGRLMAKRPVVFYMRSDVATLRDSGLGVVGGFEAIGTPVEGGSDGTSPLRLADYISYDEMALAALCSIRVPTVFINSGSRHNRAALDPGEGHHEREGVYWGQVGARFEKRGRMEWTYCIAGDDAAPSPVTLLLERYFRQSPDDGVIPLRVGGSLKAGAYRARVRAVVGPFLRAAHQAGRSGARSVYVQTVGLGLGVWQISPAQNELFVRETLAVLEGLVAEHGDALAVSDLNFSWIRVEKAGEFPPAAVGPVTVHFSQRDPAAPLTGPDQGKLLFVNFAWDGNSLPGNEYWLGSLAGSGDPAAVCCSTVAELGNVYINKDIIDRIYWL